MPEHSIHTFKFDRISPHKTVLITHVYYPDDTTSHGPYCLSWNSVLRKHIPTITEKLQAIGYIPFHRLLIDNNQ
jgi:hypothetical protein